MLAKYACKISYYVLLLTRMRYGIAVIIVILFAIIGSVMLIGRGNSGKKPASLAKTTKLADYASIETSRISWTMQGRLVGEDQYRAVRVTVTRSTRTVEILDGYGERTERKAEYKNSAEGYQTFTRALDLANFGRERVVKNPDERGVCPLGNRYIYRVQDGSREVMRTWSDTCVITDGPSAGTPSLITQLFKSQIPDYSKFTAGVQL